MPMPRVKPTGVTEIELIVGAVTVRLVELLMLPRVAEMFVEPAATAVTKPFASTVATAVEDEPQVTSAVRLRLLQSQLIPDAVNCSVVLTGTVASTVTIVIRVMCETATH